MLEVQGTHNKSIIYAALDTVDAATKGQVTALLNQESVSDSTIRIMPDCHAGAASVIGTTMTIVDNVIPNLVGVDIGCGVLVVKLDETRINLPKLDSLIKKEIPVGFEIRSNLHKNASSITLENLKCAKSVNLDRAYKSVGTLGGGNHFIEIDEDENQNKYLVIHTGSRNLGKQIAEYYQSLAFDELHKNPLADEIKTLTENMKADGKQKEIQKAIKELKKQKPSVPKELSYLVGDNFSDYIHDMKIAQEFAVLNRRTIADIILKASKLHEVESFETIHNYIDMRTENYDGKYMLRKGAISALEDEVVIIPINMRDGCLIAKGKGNVEYNKSAPHGAGRIMSRAQAKKEIILSNFKDSMSGIFSTTVNMSTIDEAPMAYKPIEAILPHIEDTVEIINTIKPVYNFKAQD